MGRDDRNAEKPPRAPKHGRGRSRTEVKPSGGPPRSRWPLPRLILLGGALLLAIGLTVSLLGTRPGAGPQSSTGVADVGGPFRLVDQDARPVDETLLRGRWSAIFFGYTYCPDVCPATLTALKVVKDRLGPKAKDLQAVFVTIDPARDTPAQLKSYLSSPAFPQPIVGLTGTDAQIAAVAKAYKVYYAKSGSGPDYLMDHASAIYLMDPMGRFHSLVSTAQGMDSMTSGIGQAMGLN